MEYKVKTLTKDGATMFAQADAQKQPVVVDKMVISDNKVDPNSDLTGLTIDDFTNNHEFDASNTTQNDTSFTVVSVMTNKGFTADYDVNLIGLLAHIGTDTANEKIIAIATGDDPFTLPQDTGTPVQLVPAFTTGFGTATNVTVTVSDEAYVLKSDLDNIFKVNLGSYTPTSELTDYISSNLPADVAKTDAANTFTKQQTFSAGAVNGNGKKALFDGDVDLSGTQPKGDYANNADLTALKNAVNSTSTGLPSKMATADADKKYETSAHASSTYETQADAKNKVNTADTSNWQKQALFNPGSFMIDQAGDGNGITFHDLLVKKYANPGVYFIRDSATTSPQNYYVDALVISEPGGWWYCYGIAGGNSIFVTRTIQPDKTVGRIDSGWVTMARSKDIQSAINQAHTDMLSELTNRGYPASIWTGTQAQYDAMSSHDNHIEYRING